MRLIKLDAIDSTNDFLKNLAAVENLENFTVVTAENQTKGKGQMGAVWNSEVGKNLIMSVLVKDFIPNAQEVFTLNIAFSLAVIDVLTDFKIPQLSIKWPNDILSGNKKIGGILIENSFRSDRQIVSVAGLGLNVNQTHFENLPKASSLALLCGAWFDKGKLLDAIIHNLERRVHLWSNSDDSHRSEYISLLFKKDVPMPFQNPQGMKFMGIIEGISTSGKLLVQLEDETVSEFDIREIQMLY